jgi:hypothetical protein
VIHKYTLLAKLVNTKYYGALRIYSALKLRNFRTPLSELWQTRGWKLWEKGFILPPCEFMNTYKEQFSIADCSNRVPRKQKVWRSVHISVHIEWSRVPKRNKILTVAVFVLCPTASCMESWVCSGLNGWRLNWPFSKQTVCCEDLLENGDKTLLILNLCCRWT